MRSTTTWTPSCSRALAELRDRQDAGQGVRAVIWRAEGKSWSSGRDVGSIGVNKTDLTHHQLMSRGHRGIQQLWELDAPVIVAIQGWAIGGSFQRALLCDIRIAADDARFMLPETTYGVIPDTGGMGVLYEMCGHGLVSDMVLTGRRLSADEALGHGIVSRVVPRDELDATAREMAEKIAAVAGGDHQDGPQGDLPSRPARHRGVDGGRADLPDVRQQERGLRRVPVRPGRGARPDLPRELTMTDASHQRDHPGLPGPPAAGDTALKPGTFDGEVVVVTGGGTGLGKAIASEFARLGASIVLASRKPEHLEAGRGGDVGARRAGAHGRLRHP